MSFLSDIFNSAKPMLGALAPAAGTALGSMLGGPAGAAIGGGLGTSLGNYFNEKPAAPQMPAQNQGMMGRAGQNFGQNMGRRMGNAMPQNPMSQFSDTPMQMMPQRGGAMAGRAMGNAINSRFNSSVPNTTFGHMASGFGRNLGNNFASMLPEQYQSYGRDFGNGIGSFIRKGMGDYGNMNPNRMMRQLPQKMSRFGQNIGRQRSQQMMENVPRGMQRQSPRSMPGYMGREMGNYLDRGLNRAMPNQGFGMQPESSMQGDLDYEGMGSMFDQGGQGGQSIPMGNSSGEYEGMSNMYGDEGYADGGSVVAHRSLRDLLSLMEEASGMGYAH